MKSNRRLVRLGLPGYTQHPLMSADELPPLRDTKRCCQCKEVKPIASFLSVKRDKMYWACLDCVRAHKRRWYKEGGQTVTDANHGYHLRATYGITLEQYEQLSGQQNHLCAICGKPEVMVYKSYGKTRTQRLAVDHDHGTGTVRALLCSNCNTTIGSFAHDPDLVRKAAAYLLRTATEPAVPHEQLTPLTPRKAAPTLTPELQEELRVLLAEADACNAPWTGKDVRAWMEERLGRPVSYPSAWGYLQRLMGALQVQRLQNLRADA